MRSLSFNTCFSCAALLVLFCLATPTRAALVTYDVDLQSGDVGASVTGTVLFDTSTSTVQSTDLTLTTIESPTGDAATFQVVGSDFTWYATPTTLTFDPIQFGSSPSGARVEASISDSNVSFEFLTTNSGYFSPTQAGELFIIDNTAFKASNAFGSTLLFGTAPIAVPEPGTFAVAGLAVPALGFWVRKKHKSGAGSI
jgi:hypothetical protein